MEGHEPTFDATDGALSQTLQRARKEERYGLRELARRSGLSAGQLSRIEAGKIEQPSIKTLIRLARALERDADALIVLAEKPRALTGPRLQAARVRLLQAIGSLTGGDRAALAGYERQLAGQVEQVEQLQAAEARLEARRAEARAAARDARAKVSDLEVELAGAWRETGVADLASLTAALSAASEHENATTQTADTVERELDELRTERAEMDEKFVWTVRAAAYRLFSEVRGRESSASPAASWRLPPASEGKSAETEWERSLEDPELRQLLRAWEQLNPDRQRRVVEFVEDQRLLSIQDAIGEERGQANQPRADAAAKPGQRKQRKRAKGSATIDDA